MNRLYPCRSLRACLVGLQLAAVIFASLGPSVQTAPAQPAGTSEVDSRTAADAARCLAIDNEIAALAVAARKGEITAEARKQRADALTAERTRITAPYGARTTPANRALVAEFNRLKAAMRETAVAAAKAKREDAAAEVKAKREAALADVKAKREREAAETQARRDTAATELRAKHEAAVAAEAEKAQLAAKAEDALMVDVSTVADERLQRARDKFYRDFGLAPPTSDAQAKQQTIAAQAVRATHVPPATTTLRPTFDERVDRLYQLRLPERTNGWFAEVFPTSGDIVTAFPDATRQSAALEVASRRLTEHTPGVRPLEAQSKIESYQAARGKLKPDFSAVTRLTGDKEFEAQLFDKSLPSYSVSLRQQIAREKMAKEMANFQDGRGVMSACIRLCLAGLFLWLPVRLMRRQRFRWKRQTQADWEAKMAASPLSPELRWVQVPGFRYPVTLFSGRVYDKEIWTETNVTTTTSTTGGGGSGYYYSPVRTTTQTHVATTVYHRYWMLTTEGAETWHRYTDNEFIATSGQKVSSIWSDNYWSLLAFNHSTGSISFPAWWTKTMHTPPYWRNVGLNVLVGLVVAMAIAATAWPLLPHVSGYGVNEQIPLLSKDAFAALASMVPFLVIYVAIVRMVFTRRRQNHFRKNVVPAYEAFLRGYDPVIPEAKAK